MSHYNVNIKTGIQYGYISSHCLDSEIVTELLNNGKNCAANERCCEWILDEAQKALNSGEFYNIEDATEDAENRAYEFWESYEEDEPIVEGTLEGVTYCSSWLGGALNFFISESPHITDCARECSICVPHAGNLDNLDGSYTCYDVPKEWRRE
jgi:hypothetical protein